MDIIQKINMNKIYHGIIIKVVPYKESDAIVSLLTKDEGIISFKARGVFKINSKTSSSLQLFTIGDFKLEYKTDYSNKTLSSDNSVYFPLCIYEDLKYSCLLSFISEIINVFKENNNECYDLLEFAILNLDKIDILTYSLISLKYLLKWNGVLFQVDSCVGCNNTHIEVFNYHSGGFLCKKCMINTSNNINSLLYLKQIRIIMKAHIENIFAFSVDNVIGYKILLDITKYLEQNLGIYLKSKEMLYFSINNTHSGLTQ